MDINLDSTNTTERYRKISSDMFFEGMLVPADLYCKHRNNYVLVFKKELLTAELLLKIKHLELTYGNLYVQNEFFTGIVDQTEMYKMNLKNINFNSSYNSVKEKTINILDEISSTSVIPQKPTFEATDIIHDRIVNIDEATIFQILNNVRTVDEYLYTHSTNVAVLNGLMGKWLGLSNKDVSSLIRAGLLHDIGKLKIPPHILNKPGELTKDEFAIIKTHPVHAYNMLISSGELDPVVLAAARNHHEKVNGKGYPDKLIYDDIPLAARITAISDVYDAMITRRAYKDAHSPFEILEEFAKGSFVDLDMDLLQVFISNLPGELVGKSVLLSNGSIGEIVFVDESNLLYPIVKVGSDVFRTDDEVKCVCMYQNNG